MYESIVQLYKMRNTADVELASDDRVGHDAVDHEAGDAPSDDPSKLSARYVIVQRQNLFAAFLVVRARENAEGLYDHVHVHDVGVESDGAVQND